MMSKVKYDALDPEMNPFHPCLKCESLDFIMDWDSGLSVCEACGEPLEVEPAKKMKKKVMKFRGLNDEDEVY